MFSTLSNSRPESYSSVSQEKQHNNVFALKTFEETFLKELTIQRFTKELEANRFAPPHDRIVPVLAAFQHRHKCHLLFSWADGGSLEDFWRNFSPYPTEPSEGAESSAKWGCESWLLQECVGIAEALAAIHGFGNKDRTGYTRQIHADLKPENILCFLSKDGEHPTMTVKLADLGEAIRLDDESHVKAEKAMVPHTKTYRPPEYNPVDLKNLNYDVWCLGCLYLDFITWFLDGWEAVETFGDSREDEGDDASIATADGPPVIEDIFFKRVRETQIPTLSISRRSKASNKSGQHIVRSSIGIVSSFRIEHKVKKQVLMVSFPRVPSPVVSF